ncbi:hypothetical protein G7046_g4904 [Stylonectria norvegica]|nr:hypothetical protein G7046_g4904 [Stylonectria norvegica]
MARQRKEKPIKGIKLVQPDRSGPSEKTLFELAEERQLFLQAERRNRENTADVLSPGAERVLEVMLWTVTLAILHFTFDVLVQNQFGTSIKWPQVWIRTARAWVVFAVLFYPLHPHEANPVLIPGLPLKYQRSIRQATFFTMSTVCGCYLIHITNTYGYLATMKQAPPVGCLWIWAVVELDLLWAVLSLALAAGFVWQGGYDFK